MDYSEAFMIIPKCILSLAVLFLVTKLIGKKQVSQLSLFDYVIGISIGNFTAEMVMGNDGKYLNGIVAIITFGVVAYLISVVATKSIHLRRIIIGVPTLIIENGNILIDALKKVNIDINDLLEEMRNAGYFDISEINFAIMEADGKMSFLPFDKNKPVTKKDMNIKSKKETLTANIIIDSKLMLNNIKYTDKKKDWFIHELKVEGYDTYEDILLATYKDNKLNIYKKNPKKIPNDVLE